MSNLRVLYRASISFCEILDFYSTQSTCSTGQYATRSACHSGLELHHSFAIRPLCILSHKFPMLTLNYILHFQGDPGSMSWWTWVDRPFLSSVPSRVQPRQIFSLQQISEDIQSEACCTAMSNSLQSRYAKG